MIEKLWICVVLSFCIIYKVYQNDANAKSLAPIVRIDSGELRGIKSVSRDGREFSEYLGIPYAKPPIGNLRFEAPQEPGNWTGIREASAYGNECTQVTIIFESPTGKEDCLFLNVFTPKERQMAPDDSENLFPTMVFIHGGLFLEGSGNMYRPEYFMDEDVVLVTLNYRLGALGFLNTGDGVIPGNAGLKDQNAALRWIQRNIAQFGGNPKQVSIFGESAGAASVHLHMLSSMSQGLFQKAISQSGNGLDPWSIVKEPKKQAVRFGRLLNCPVHNTSSMVDCLKNVPIEYINDIQMEAKDRVQDPIFHYLPSVEVTKEKNSFLSEQPSSLAKNQKNSTKWMTGINKHDGLLLFAIIARNQTLQNYIEDPDNWLTAMRNMLFRTDLTIDQVKQLRKLYFGTEGPIDFWTHVENYTNLFSDIHFNYGLVDAVKLHSQHSPVYVYQFSYPGEFSFYNTLVSSRSRFMAGVEIIARRITVWIKKNVFGMDLPRYVASHGDELACLFKLDLLHEITPQDKDYKISKRMIKLWTTFAADETSMEHNGTNWKPFDPKKAEFEVFNIDTEGGYIKSPFVDRVQYLHDNGF